ncbi:magnesium transporter NIPA3 [Salpingoeca rosetta]|uniref:Magnesium transporter NIPA3 n=1 Tax=Salpingoeca rosetta (strain ATCC 50818 / BSB-021) TaxID=946362 RepID=F2U4I0_SALR5|nr:magnesium transporter NIPA3 [Salpingoeca rosetta]EGD82546.1 magnesium transporter NIPA3 [Salpingoeca rosetta]|eukprot:XP_004995782.1 magnesium transporter NIPA3 [Salpingoeca rosetta]
MDNRDNRIGVGLALSSSAFIGLSFIVKKKGLIRSRASGSSAGDGGFAYLREWLWWVGLLTMVAGEAANFIAYAFAPAILVTPLGALSVIISAVLASWLLKERLLLLGKLGCAMCIVGSTVIVLNAPEEKEVSSVSEITDQMFDNAPFLGYAVCVILLSLYLIFIVAPKHGKRNIFVNITICSVVGSLSVIGVKGLGIALKLTLQGSNQLGNASTWGFVAMVAVCIMTQMNYLNKALDTFNTALVTPIYYVLFTTCTILASALLFRGWTQQAAADDDNCPAGSSAPALITCLCGFLTICGGVFLLHKSREDAAELTRTRDDDLVELINQRAVSDSMQTHAPFEQDEHAL